MEKGSSAALSTWLDAAAAAADDDDDDAAASAEVLILPEPFVVGTSGAQVVSMTAKGEVCMSV